MELRGDKIVFYKFQLIKRVLGVIDKRYNYPSIIARKLNSTNSNMVVVLQQLQHFGLVKRKKVGINNFVELTDKGKKIRNKLREIEEIELC